MRGTQVLPSVDVVLLSQPDSEHIGALPYLVAKHGLQAPIYGTGALQKMGQMCLYAQVNIFYPFPPFYIHARERERAG